MSSESLTYCIPYLLCGAAYLLFFVIERLGTRFKALTWVSWIACPLLFIFFFGFRGYVGYDYAPVYHPLFESVENLGDVLECEHEKGFVLLTWFVRQFTDDWNVYVLIMTILDALVLQWLFHRHSLSLALSYFVMFSVDLVFEVDLMRNVKAILIFLCAVDFILKRQLLLYVIAILFACTFHKTSILFLPMYFMLNCKFSARQYAILLLIMNAIYFLRIPLGGWVGSFFGLFAPAMTEAYLEGDFNAVARGITVGWFPKVLPFVFGLVCLERLRAAHGCFNVFFNLYAVYLIVCLGFSDTDEFMRRMSYLCEPAVWFVWPVMYACMSKGIFRVAFISMVAAYGGMKIVGQTKILPFYYENILLDESAATFESKRQELNDYKDAK